MNSKTLVMPKSLLEHKPSCEMKSTLCFIKAKFSHPDKVRRQLYLDTSIWDRSFFCSLAQVTVQQEYEIFFADKLELSSASQSGAYWLFSSRFFLVIFFYLALNCTFIYLTSKKLQTFNHLYFLWCDVRKDPCLICVVGFIFNQHQKFNSLSQSKFFFFFLIYCKLKKIGV